MACRFIGVDRVLLHDNNEDGGQQAAELSDFITDGFLSLFTVQGEAQQIPVYQYCVTHSGQQFSWLAALDIDEFIVVEDVRANQRPPSSRLKSVLEDFRFQPGLFLSGPLRHGCSFAPQHITGVSLFVGGVSQQTSSLARRYDV